MDQFIATYPALVGLLLVGLFGLCLSLVGVIWGMVTGSQRELKDAIRALNKTLASAFDLLRGMDKRLSHLEGQHEVNHRSFRVGGSE